MSAPPAARSLLSFDAAAFGRWLVESGDITQVDWRLAQQVATENRQSPVRALLDLGLIGADVLADRLAASIGCDRWNARDEQRSISDRVPASFLRGCDAALLEDDGDGAAAQALICADPSDRHAWGSVLSQLGSPPAIQVGTHREIAALYEQRDHEGERIDEEQTGGLDITTEVDQLRDMASEAPVIRFLNQTVERAMDLGASDIHLERFDHTASLRMRVDGLLAEQTPPAQWMIDPLLCRIKIMASLDIAERRRAQDGRIQMRLRGRMVDLRVSLLPTLYGQDAVLRLQDRQKLGKMRLEDLGFPEGQTEALQRAASKSHGMVLVTGPTGSGKTTTLYALLRRLITAERKIVTVEDPVEYAIDGVNQVGVNTAVGRSFSNTLRHILRHDPDVILVGEIRDHETAEMAFQAALTGHMVLTTLHTNDVPSSYTRLLDIGVEPFLVNTAVECATAQRLVRRLCPACGNEPSERSGCETCLGLGYRGRVAVMEYALTTPELKAAIREHADERRIAGVLAGSGFRSIREQARELVAAGVTDEAELVRALGPAEEDPAPAGASHGA